MSTFFNNDFTQVRMTQLVIWKNLARFDHSGRTQIYICYSQKKLCHIQERSTSVLKLWEFIPPPIQADETLVAFIHNNKHLFSEGIARIISVTRFDQHFRYFDILS